MSLRVPLDPLVVYLTFMAKSVHNALIFPLPTSIQAFMDEFSSYTAAFSIHTSSNLDFGQFETKTEQVG